MKKDLKENLTPILLSLAAVVSYVFLPCFTCGGCDVDFGKFDLAYLFATPLCSGISLRFVITALFFTSVFVAAVFVNHSDP